MNPESLARIFVLLATGFFCAAGLVILFLFLSRVFKSARQKKEATFLSTLQSSLNGLLFLEGDVPAASYQFNLDQIKKVIRHNRLATQILINLIINLKKSLSGSSAKVLEKIYHDLDLYQFSIKKLSSFSWSRRAQGIRELSELNNNSTLNIIPTLKTRNKTLKEELLLSTIRLDKQNPLGFLDQWEGEITEWMRIHIHHYLSQLDPRTLPDFSKWFSSPREDVVIFAVNMARQFQQSGTASGLVKLLPQNNSTIVTSAIRALTDLEAFAVVDDVTAIADRYWQDETISRAIVLYLGKTGHSAAHFLLLDRYLGHNFLSVRLDTVRALLNLGEQGNTILQQHQASDSRIQQLILHASEPTLR